MGAFYEPLTTAHTTLLLSDVPRLVHRIEACSIVAFLGLPPPHS